MNERKYSCDKTSSPNSENNYKTMHDSVYILRDESKQYRVIILKK